MEDDLTLRAAEQSSTLFWSKSHRKQLLPAMHDKLAFGGQRDLAENEVITMALNEVAAERGRGFFFHFRNRDSRKKSVAKIGAAALARDGELCPASRAPPSNISPEMPSIAYMDFVWDQQLQKGFVESSHRSRYLKCDGQLNLPHGATPLYGIQHVANPRYALYVTSPQSLVIVATDQTLYLASTSELEDLFGRWPAKKPKPVGPSPELRLNTTPYLWSPKGEEANMSTTERHIYRTMRQRFEVGNVESLYDRMIEIRRTEKVMPNLTANQIREMAPRAPNPESGVPLGIPLQIVKSSNEVHSSSNPPSRRGGHLTRTRLQRRSSEVDSEQEDEQKPEHEALDNNIEID